MLINANAASLKVSYVKYKFSWWRPGLIQFILGLMALIFFERVDAAEWWMSGVFLVISGLALLLPLYRALKRPVEIVLSDHLFVLACAFFAYYVVGALLLPLGPHEQADYSMSYYKVDAAMAMRVAAVNSIGFGIALMANVLAPKRIFSRFGYSAVQVGSKIPLELIISVFLLIGSFSYLYVLQFDLTQYQQGGVISGVWRSLQKLLLVAVVLAVAHRGGGARWLRSVAVLIVIFQVIGGLLMLNKSEVLLPMVALMVGYAWRIGVRRVLLPGLILILSIYLLIGSAVTAGRNLSGATSNIEWNYRISILWDEIFGYSSNLPESENNPWSRFCYTPPQAAALNFYDGGKGGDDFEKIGWVFLPRFLFPNKPIITASGPEFHFKIRGNMDSSTGHGVFINGYYNLGLLGVLISGLGVGIILACTSSFAREVFKARAMLWLPFAMLGSYMAFRIDGHFLADYMGPFALLLYVFIGILFVRKLFGRRQVL